MRRRTLAYVRAWVVNSSRLQKNASLVGSWRESLRLFAVGRTAAERCIDGRGSGATGQKLADLARIYVESGVDEVRLMGNLVNVSLDQLLRIVPDLYSWCASYPSQSVALRSQYSLSRNVRGLSCLLRAAQQSARARTHAPSPRTSARYPGSSCLGDKPLNRRQSRQVRPPLVIRLRACPITPMTSRPSHLS